MDLIKDPGPNWLERLREGHQVWLSKEKRVATVIYAYEPAVPGFRTGRIAIHINCGIEVWRTDSDGKGFDGASLFEPIVGNLPENPSPLPDPEVRRLNREIEHLDKRISHLERLWLPDVIEDFLSFLRRWWTV